MWTLPWADHRLCSLELSLGLVKSPGDAEVGKQYTQRGVLWTGKKVDRPGCFPLAGVNRSLQAPGAWGPPGEAGHRSHGHWEDHLGLLDKVTGGKLFWRKRSQGRLSSQPQPPSLCVAGIGSSLERQSSFPLWGQGGRPLAPSLGRWLWSDLGFWNAKSLFLCNLSYSSPAPSSKFKGKPSPSSWPDPLRYSEASCNPWGGEGGPAVLGSRVSSRALPRQGKRGHQPVSLESPALLPSYIYSEAS